MINDYNKMGSIYAKHDITGTAYLAFKDLPKIINQYSNGKKCLDFGCGSGSSTRFLKELGLNVVGADVNLSMLKEAESFRDNIEYHLIENNSLPYLDSQFDIVFSSFVLFEISSKAEMINTFNEIYRILKKNGVFIAITGSSDMYKYPWVSLGTDFPENKNLKSGDLAKVYLKEIDLLIYDFYWTENDYIEVISHTNFKLKELIYPLADKNTTQNWKTETTQSPYLSLILKK